MTDSPADKVRAALAETGTNVSLNTAAQIAARLGDKVIKDATTAELLGHFAQKGLNELAAEVATPKPPTREERARAYVDNTWGANPKRTAQDTQRLYNEALKAIDREAAPSHTARVVAEINAKDPSRHSTLDMLAWSNARAADAGNRPVVSIPAVPASSLPADTPRDPYKRLQAVNRLSGVGLAAYREWSAARAALPTIKDPVLATKLSHRVEMLARQCRFHGVSLDGLA